MGLEEGKRFVDFNLKNQDGETVKLDDFKGKWLVVYVYPKDDTPGCTIQGKSFTASKQEFDDAGIEVVKILQQPDIKTLWDSQGAVAPAMPPAEFARFQRAEIERWGKVVRDAKIKIDN